MNKDCARAEILAGAVALGEASEIERDDYRRHISVCASCLNALGGEREIERVMETVANARESEVWEPVPLRAGERRARRVYRFVGFGLSTAAVAVVASLGIHALVAANVHPVTIADAPANVDTSPVHVTLEHRSAPQAAVKPKVSQGGIVVVHNVITLKQPDRNENKPPVQTSQTTTVVAEAPAPAPAPAKAAPAAGKAESSDVPVWRRGAPFPHAGSLPAATIARADTPPVLAGHAESIAVAPSFIVRDVAPIGGETAINPRPAPIAYAQQAEGTTAFEVSVDERGAPTKCTITKSSGYLSLDEAVCKAAMKARYSPRTVNGRATTGIYRDAFTFRALQPNTDQPPPQPQF